MNTSVIRHRVADFLRRYAPLDSLDEEDLLNLASSGRVKFHESEEYVFCQRQPIGKFVWIIQQGRVELLDEQPEGEQLRDVMGEGDLIGWAHFAGSASHLYSARTATDVILYGLDLGLFEALTSRYPSLKSYLVAHYSMASTVGAGCKSWLNANLIPFNFLRVRLALISPDFSTTEAAASLRAAKNGVLAVVDGDRRPIGILTSGDICAAIPSAY